MKRTLKGIRNDMNLSAKEFGKRIGCSEDTVYNYETGRTKIPPEIIDKILELTGLKYEDIIFYNKNTTKS